MGSGESPFLLLISNFVFSTEVVLREFAISVFVTSFEPLLGEIAVIIEVSSLRRSFPTPFVTLGDVPFRVLLGMELSETTICLARFGEILSFWISVLCLTFTRSIFYLRRKMSLAYS